MSVKEVLINDVPPIRSETVGYEWDEFAEYNCYFLRIFMIYFIWSWVFKRLCLLLEITPFILYNKSSYVYDSARLLAFLTLVVVAHETENW